MDVLQVKIIFRLKFLTYFDSQFPFPISWKNEDLETKKNESQPRLKVLTWKYFLPVTDVLVSCFNYLSWFNFCFPFSLLPNPNKVQTSIQLNHNRDLFVVTNATVYNTVIICSISGLWCI